MSYTMQAIADDLQAEIQAQQLLTVHAPWADEIVFPYYQGLSLLNVARTVLDRLGVSQLLPLDDRVWGGAPPDVDRVVLLLTDGLGYLHLQDLIAQDNALAEDVAAITAGRGPVPLTSVAPSTTAVALPTLWTAQPAGVTGMAGTVMFLREIASLGDVLFFRHPAAPKGTTNLEDWGLEANQFVSQPSVADQLVAHGVETHLLLDKALAGTGLSRILHRGVANVHMHTGNIDLWLRFEDVLQQTRGQRCYVSAYWPVVDTLSHFYGARNRYLHNEIRWQMQNLRALLHNEAIADGRTLVMILADHGHVDVPNTVDLATNPAAQPLRDALRLSYGAESRFSYLYIREGYRQQAIETIETHFADQLAWMDGQQAIEAGLFGPGPRHPEIFHRVGDLIVLSRPGYHMIDSIRKGPTRSKHGGLSEYDMLVPFMWKVI
jgi:predicted AlkP superfamily pyrophosphatase or phosphodiesterase